MINKKITLIYFSPTATTKTVLDAIAKGTGYAVDSYDITMSQAREKIPQTLDTSLIVFGSPEMKALSLITVPYPYRGCFLC
ncbi:MAG: hypothetical protein RQ739_01125 [Desulfotignum sp.]|nr:hypothetical protein [Desulfotignum sp.]